MNSMWHRWRTFTRVGILIVSVAAMWNASTNVMSVAQEGKVVFSVDYSMTTLEEELQQDVSAFLSQNTDHLVTDKRQFVVTVQYSDVAHQQHIRLVPAEVYESNWSLPLAESDIVSLVIAKTGESRWEIAFDQIYTSTVAPQEINSSYSFPWTGGQTWLKTQGFHYSNLGYSLDFTPGSGASNTVRAIESGTLTIICYHDYDPYQAMVRVSHSSNGDVSGYLHLDKGSVPSNLFNQTIPKGQVLGSVYTGSAFSTPYPAACTDLSNYKFVTPCGCGYETHLHFEANHLITIQGYSLQSISDAANNETAYTSNNSSSNCCACSTLTAYKESNVWKSVWTASSTSTVPNQMSFRTLPLVFQPIIATTPQNVLTDLSTPPADILLVAPSGLDVAPAAPAASAPTIVRAPVEPLREPPVSTSYAIPKSVFGSGGGPKIATSYRLQGTSGQTTETGTLASNSYRLRSGYWNELACPLAELTAAPDISVSAAIVTLKWVAVAGASTYRIYRGTEPYFVPGTPYDSTANTAWTDPSGAGDPFVNHTYVVKAVNACGESGTLYRVGQFGFALTPGS